MKQIGYKKCHLVEQLSRATERREKCKTMQWKIVGPSHYALSYVSRASFGAHAEIQKTTDPYNRWQKCSNGVLVSKTKSWMLAFSYRRYGRSTTVIAGLLVIL